MKRTFKLITTKTAAVRRSSLRLAFTRSSFHEARESFKGLEPIYNLKVKVNKGH